MIRTWLGRACASAVLIAGAIGCDGKGSAPTDPNPLPRPGLTIERGASIADTAMGRPLQALVVRVRGEDGKPRSGLVVRFESIVRTGPNLYVQEPEALVGRLTGETIGQLATETTDAEGRAQVLVQMGRIAGPARIVVTVPTEGLQDTARFTVTPASAYGVSLAPRDTFLSSGKTYTLRGGVVDRWGNTREDAVIFTSSRGVAVDANRSVSTTEPGRSFVVVQAMGKVDTAWVSVLPEGTVATYGWEGGGRGIVTMNLDGTDRQLVISRTGFPDHMAPIWAPSGSEIVFQDGDNSGKRLYQVDLNGTVRRFIEPAPSMLLSEEWPQFSRDGQSVYFLGRAAGTVNLWRVGRDGTGATIARPSGDNRLNDAWHPSPSPDGKRLAFAVGEWEPRVQVLDLTTGSVSSLDIPGNTPRWSPREDLIAYRKPDYTIGVIRPDGTGQRTVTRLGARYDFGFNWSPDGEWLVAHNINGNWLDVIHVESGVALAVPFSNRLSNPSWKP